MESRTVTFLVKAERFPAGWHECKRDLRARASSRATDQHPLWMRIDGRGFTIWLSDVAVADSRTEPTTWSICVEALTELPPEGRRCWDESIAAIRKFLEREALPFEAL